jgi:hypothetical protein
MSSLSSIKKGIAKKAAAEAQPKPQSPLERISELETIFTGLVQSYGKMVGVFQELSKRITSLETSVAALIDIEGVSAVQKKISDLRDAEREASAEAIAQNISARLAEGSLVVAAEVTDGTTLVLQNRDAAGKVQVPSRTR